METEYFVLRRVNCSNGGTDIIGITDNEEFAKSQQSVFCGYEKVKFLERDTKEKIKELAENYHDRLVMSMVSGSNKNCECCRKETITLTCIEKDDKDYSKDVWLCDKCYAAIVAYWKEHSPKKICPI